MSQKVLRSLSVVWIPGYATQEAFLKRKIANSECAHVCDMSIQVHIYICVQVYRGQRSTSDVVSSSGATCFVSQVRASHLELGPMGLPQLVQQAPGILLSLHCEQALRLQACITMPMFFVGVGIKVGPSAYVASTLPIEIPPES